MLTRQKTILAILSEAKESLSRTVLVKLAFLLRQEQLGPDQNFYDFLPYRFGPFSFALYRELETLKRDGYIADRSDRYELTSRNQLLTEAVVRDLPVSLLLGVQRTVTEYSKLDQTALLKDVYRRYPWFAIKSELSDLIPSHVPIQAIATPAVYTIGYEGRSVDRFFDHLLQSGLKMILDVRSNPSSRKYGFSKSTLSDIAGKVGLHYRHLPELGIPGNERAELNDFNSYQVLLDTYSSTTIPRRSREVEQLAILMGAAPSALLCFERDTRCCHRTRLAEAIANVSQLEVVHL